MRLLLSILRFFNLVFIDWFSFLNSIHIINKVTIDLILLLLRLIEFDLWYFVYPFPFLWWMLSSILEIEKLEILCSLLIIIYLLYLNVVLILLIILFILQVIILLKLNFLVSYLIVSLLVLKWTFLSIILRYNFDFLKIKILFWYILIIIIVLIKWL